MNANGPSYYILIDYRNLSWLYGSNGFGFFTYILLIVCYIILLYGNWGALNRSGKTPTKFKRKNIST
ncbi:hypothetical protein D8M06_08295 [Oceanobacillus halophilus]|uniref:Uncharacterized protein n=1 Tax=Oceanobacillus halophilus TaxID=930130 RepID=A0A495A5L6_9BACI|nr:hypothetical protein D8M06_08295 [Oceanobacillus halophilus]